MLEREIMLYEAISVGILIQNQKTLLGLRKKEDCWEFPGGSLEKGEQAETAVKRELKEELSISVTELEIAGSLSYYKPKTPRLIILFYITKWNGEIQKNWHRDLKWFSLEDCRKQQIPNINPELFEGILKLLSKKI